MVTEVSKELIMELESDLMNYENSLGLLHDRNEISGDQYSQTKIPAWRYTLRETSMGKL